MFPPYVFWAVFAACCTYGLWRGGAPERMMAFAFLVAGLATPLVNLPPAGRFYSVSIGVLAIDLALLGSVIAIALRADRFWPILVAGMQIVIILAHLVKFANPDLIRRAYAIMIAGWSYPQLLLLALGSWRHRMRIRAHGTDISWSNFSKSSIRRTPMSGRPVL
ncbi:hypothetical protein [Sphingomonas cavernae]|uniref:hypothetical protein n=1 Tax=Sphingomonas cavernae TaxID=2320861 RepID=UPI00160033F1|nr:hypothetical protein [Sphingomonas cavernae]